MAERRGAAVYDLCLTSGWVGCEVSPTVLIGWGEGVVVGVGVVSVLVGIEKSSTTGASINLASAATHSKTKWSDLFLTKQKLLAARIIPNTGSPATGPSVVLEAPGEAQVSNMCMWERM